MNVILTGVNELPAPGDDTVAGEQAFFDAERPGIVTSAERSER
jgi:hypothetical protein